MKVKDVITKLRVMLAEKEEVIETKMAEATLVDGTEDYTEGALEPGAILFVRAGEGVSEDPFAPAGMHETTTGLIVEVGEAGEILSVEEKSTESMRRSFRKAKFAKKSKRSKFDEAQEVAEEITEEVAEAVEEAVEVAVEESMEDILKAIVSVLAPYMAKIEKVTEEVETLEARFNKIAAEPAAKKITSKFSANKGDVASATEARFAKLVEMRKSGSKL
jgi:flagellar biosynthesis/type III secretory pathway protein FliH